MAGGARAGNSRRRTVQGSVRLDSHETQSSSSATTHHDPKADEPRQECSSEPQSLSVFSLEHSSHLHSAAESSPSMDWEKKRGDTVDSTTKNTVRIRIQEGITPMMFDSG
ncbi:MAG: hypothetical protein MUC83_04600 [Pirellula sp.]|nr:hypothetical protein [Pirellula sp.]